MQLDTRRTPPTNQDGWVAEVKYDGYRVLGQTGDGPVVLKTRNGTDCTKWFPEVVDALHALPGHNLIDGEIAILDEVGRTDFNALQVRSKRRGWRAGDRTVTYCVFDLLVQDDRDIMRERLVDRKAELERLLAGEFPHILFARHIDSETVENPVTWLYAQALALGLEGIVGKLANSPYVPGERTKYWFKLKRPGAVPPKRFKHKRCG